MSEEHPRVLIMGAGGIGGTVAGYLTEVGVNVTAVTTNEAIYRAVSEDGFRLTGDGNPRSVPGRVSLGVPTTGSYDFILLATQPPQVEEAARTALSVLAKDGRMVVFQNGLCEPRIEAIAGRGNVVGGIIAWGASMAEPGRYERTSSGGFSLGTPSGLVDSQLKTLASLLEIIGPVSITKNLLGSRWSKLALNSAISSLGTIAGERLGPLVRVRRYRRLALEIFTEVVAVARAEGVTLEKVAGTVDLEWIALSSGDKRSSGSPSLAAKHGMLLAVGLRYRRLRSSMLSAIERGRTPAVDFLNGEVATRGTEHKVPTPVNAAIVDTVWAISRGEKKSSRKVLDDLCGLTASS